MRLYMDVSRFLGKVIGIYLFIISLAMLTRFHQFSDMMNELANNNSAMFVTGFFTLILGILLVVSHNIWQWNWRVLITLVAWISLAKGIAIIFYPPWINASADLFLHNLTFAYFAIGLDFVLGLFLMYCGYRK